MVANDEILASSPSYIPQSSAAYGPKSQGYRPQDNGRAPPHVASSESGLQAPEEIKLLELQLQEAASGSLVTAASSALAMQLPELFEAMPADAVLRSRFELDSNLLFRKDGSAVDLRSLVFEALAEDARKRVLSCIQKAVASSGAGQRRGLVVLSDVDDTLLPGTDALGIAGRDRSWSTDGRPYPGVCQLHKQLQGGRAKAEHYSVLLTARPPSMCADLHPKLERIVGKKNPRLAILPGAGGLKPVQNAINILRNDFNALGKMKVQRLREYAELFPECAGRFVFIGDDGQGDLACTNDMLGLTSTASSIPLLAFAAIHAVELADGFLIPQDERAERTRALRRKRPPIDSTGLVRFFYFVNYVDLAKQLVAAGWINSTQCDMIIRASQRDSAPSLYDAVEAETLFPLLMGLRARFHGDGRREKIDFKELDEVEKEEYDLAMAALPNLATSHVLIAPPSGLSNGPCNIEIRGSRVTTAKTSFDRPYLVVRTDDRKESWEGQGVVVVPMEILRETGQRLVLKAFTGKPWVASSSAQEFLGRCYIALEPRGAHGVMPTNVPVCAEGARVVVSLLGARAANGKKPVKVGDLAFSCRWPGGPGEEEWCFPLPKQQNES